MNYILKDRNFLTPEVARAILAKEQLIKASNPPEQIEGNLITAMGYHYVRVIQIVFQASDSAIIHPSDDDDSALLTMLASEAVLRREWDTPEEDAAWANL